MNALKIACTTALLALAGCATQSEPEFGSSVRHMIVGQTYDAAAPTDAVPSGDGQKAANAVDAYRAPKKTDQKGMAPSAILMPTSQ